MENKKNIIRSRITWLACVFLYAWIIVFIHEGTLLSSILGEEASKSLSIGMFIFEILGLLLSFKLIKTLGAVKKTIQCTVIGGLLTSIVVLLQIDYLLQIFVFCEAFLAGLFLSSCGIYIVEYNKYNNRIKVLVIGLISGYMLSFAIIMTVNYINYKAAVYLATTYLIISLLFSFALSKGKTKKDGILTERLEKSEKKALILFCVFIILKGMSKGLMHRIYRFEVTDVYIFLVIITGMCYSLGMIFTYKIKKYVKMRFLLYLALTIIEIASILYLFPNLKANFYLMIRCFVIFGYGILNFFQWKITLDLAEVYKRPSKIVGIFLAMCLIGDVLGTIIIICLRPANKTEMYRTGIFLMTIFFTVLILPMIYKVLDNIMNAKADVKTEENNIDYTYNNLFTSRETDVVKLLVTGKTYRDISEELFISENTVKFHVRNIYSKANAKNRTELINIVLNTEI